MAKKMKPKAVNNKVSLILSLDEPFFGPIAPVEMAMDEEVVNLVRMYRSLNSKNDLNWEDCDKLDVMDEEFANLVSEKYNIDNADPNLFEIIEADVTRPFMIYWDESTFKENIKYKDEIVFIDLTSLASKKSVVTT